MTSRVRWSLVAACLSVLASETLTGEELEKKLTVHGHLTQAYARASDYQVLGIPIDGTFNYGRVSLLVRFAATPSDIFQVQLTHRSLGSSNLAPFEPEVGVTWGFYEHRFGESTRVRVGRQPFLFGIYGEIQHVGTVLPFYRAPISGYFDGLFFNESFDGASVTHVLGKGAPWSLEASVFGGAYGSVERAFGHIGKTRHDPIVGAEVWLETPVSGLRIGGAITGERVHDSILRGLTGRAEDNWVQYIASVEYLAGPFRAQAEWRSQNGTSPRFGPDGGYVSLGAEVLRGWTLNAQFEDMRVGLPDRGIPGNPVVSLPLYRDLGVGVAWRPVPYVVAKFEYHWSSDFLNVELPSGFPNPFTDPIPRAQYAIVSVSSSF